MRKLLQHLIFTLTCMLMSTIVNAYDFDINGIYYNVISIPVFAKNCISAKYTYKGRKVMRGHLGRFCEDKDLTDLTFLYTFTESLHTIFCFLKGF